MSSSPSASKIRRRAFLNAGIGAGLTSMMLRPLEGYAALGPPTRFLLIHRPCGTIPDRFFPAAGGSTTDFQLGPIMKPLEAFKAETVIFNDVTAPRQGNWQGDRHGAGLISMITGSRPISDGEPLNGDDQFKHITAALPSIDWKLLNESPRMKGSPVGSIHLGAYRDSVQGGRIYPEGGAANFRPVSYADTNRPIFPEIRPMVAVQKLFGNMVPGGSAAVARQQQLNKSILDLIAKDLTGLTKQVPAARRPKLDSHLSAIRQLEQQMAALPGRGACMAPAVQPGLTALPAGSPPGLRLDAVEHTRVAQEQLRIIKTGFQCDLIRAATFTFGHGNSDVQFGNILKDFGTMTGHHDISHLSDPASVTRLAAIDQYYCERLAELLTDMKNTPEADGTTLLDNTLVVFISDVSLGAGHLWQRMPVSFHGGKALGLQGGRNLKMAGRYMNDIWASVLLAFGVPLPSDNRYAGNSNWPTLQSKESNPRLGMGAAAGIFS